MTSLRLLKLAAPFACSGLVLAFATLFERALLQAEGPPGSVALHGWAFAIAAVVYSVASGIPTYASVAVARQLKGDSLGEDPRGRAILQHSLLLAVLTTPPLTLLGRAVARAAGRPEGLADEDSGFLDYLLLTVAFILVRDVLLAPFAGRNRGWVVFSVHLASVAPLLILAPVLVPRWGLAGAGLGRLAGAAFGVAAAAFLARDSLRNLNLLRPFAWFDRSLLGGLAKGGAAVGLQVLAATSFACSFSLFVASQGAEALGTVSVLLGIYGVLSAPVCGVATAASTALSRAHAEGRAREGLNVARAAFRLVAWLVAVSLLLLLALSFLVVHSPRSHPAFAISLLGTLVFAALDGPGLLLAGLLRAVGENAYALTGTLVAGGVYLGLVGSASGLANCWVAINCYLGLLLTLLAARFLGRWHDISRTGGGQPR